MLTTLTDLTEFNKCAKIFWIYNYNIINLQLPYGTYTTYKTEQAIANLFNINKNKINWIINY